MQPHLSQGDLSLKVVPSGLKKIKFKSDKYHHQNKIILMHVCFLNRLTNFKLINIALTYFFLF